MKRLDAKRTRFDIGIQPTTIFGLILLLLVSGCARSQRYTSSAAIATVRYTAKQGTLILDGQTSIHDWRVEGREIDGFVEVPSGFPAPASNASGTREQEVFAEVSIPVRSLKSVRKEAAPANGAFDEFMREKLGGERQPAIRFRLQKLARMHVGNQSQSHVFNSTGELVIGGITNSVQFPVTVSKPTGAELRFTGVASIVPDDFGLRPPIMDPPTTRLTVAISFDWTVTKTQGK
jgi:hypothetical protein